MSDHLNSRYKAGGINFVDGKLYWISDSNGPPPYDRGIFCCDPADIANPKAHKRLFNPQVESGNMIIQDGVILASHCAPASPMATGIIVSLDMGRTWAQYDLKEFGKRSPAVFHQKNSEGWFSMDLRSGWVDHAEVLFIKPKKRPIRGEAEGNCAFREMVWYCPPSPVRRNMSTRPSLRSTAAGSQQPPPDGFTGWPSRQVAPSSSEIRQKAVSRVSHSTRIRPVFRRRERPDAVSTYRFSPVSCRAGPKVRPSSCDDRSMTRQSGV